MDPLTLQIGEDGKYYVTVGDQKYPVTIGDDVMAAMEKSEDQAEGATVAAADKALSKRVMSLVDFGKSSRSAAALSDKLIPATEVLGFQVDLKLNDLAAKGKILPKQRAFLRTQAMHDFGAFCDYADTLPTIVNLKKPASESSNSDAPGEGTADTDFVEKHPKNVLTKKQIAALSDDSLATHEKVLRLTDERKCSYEQAASMVD